MQNCFACFDFYDEIFNKWGGVFLMKPEILVVVVLYQQLFSQSPAYGPLSKALSESKFSLLFTIIVLKGSKMSCLKRKYRLSS